MINIVRNCWLSLILLMQPLAVLQAESGANDKLALMEIIFEEIEPGIEPYRSRLLLGEFTLRLDDGDDRGDFILFDRKTRQINSFNHEDQSHLVMKALAVETLDFVLEYKIKKEKLLDAPKVAGQIPVQHHFYADTQLCKKSINVSGFLPEITQVLIDYEQAIVEQNKRTFSEIPGSIRSSCYMANNYLHSSDYLKAGFPLFVLDDLGRQQKLLSFGQVSKHKSIMQQPEGYSLYYPNPSNLKKQD